MKKFIFILIVLFVGNNALGQSKKELKGEWFINNLDSSFFNSDTLIFYKRTNRENDDSKKLNERFFLEPETKFLSSGDYVNLKFKKYNTVDFWETHNGYINSFWGLSISWKLKKNIFTITSEKFKWKFQIILREKATFKHLLYNTPIKKYEILSTPKLTVIRVKDSETSSE